MTQSFFDFMRERGGGGVWKANQSKTPQQTTLVEVCLQTEKKEKQVTAVLKRKMQTTKYPCEVFSL